MTALSKFMPILEVEDAKKDLAIATKNYRKVLETYVESHYKDDVSLEVRIQMMEERLEIPNYLHAKRMEEIQTAQTSVLEEIFKEFC